MAEFTVDNLCCVLPHIVVTVMIVFSTISMWQGIVTCRSPRRKSSVPRIY